MGFPVIEKTLALLFFISVGNLKKLVIFSISKTHDSNLSIFNFSLQTFGIFQIVDQRNTGFANLRGRFCRNLSISVIPDF